MNIKKFLDLVEIKTKIASMFPLIIGTFYTIYKFDTFNFLNFVLFFISLLFIDMSTTTVNHYVDYVKAKNKSSYNYKEHNPVRFHNLDNNLVVKTIITLLSIAVLMGIFLYLRTNIIILLLGGLSFFIGITYSYGPLPISRTPFGEIFSGLFMGFIIFFISIYIHLANQSILIDYDYLNGLLALYINIPELISVFLASIPLILSIANIMLVNNICDIEDDLKNNRYTLPIYLGKSNALKLFKVLTYLIYIDFIILIVFNIIPIYGIIILPTFILVYKNINIFLKKQSKKETFHICIKNFLIANTAYLITFLLAFIF